MITVTSGFNVASGYATILSVLLKELKHKDIKFRPRSLTDIHEQFEEFFENVEYFKENCDLLLFPSIPNINIANPLMHLNLHFNRLFFTMWESSRIGDLMIDKYNTNRALIVPNQWNKNNFINQGCVVPVHVVPLFIDTQIFNYSPAEKTDFFVFGTANNDPHWYNVRKRTEQTIRCFLKAFPNKKDVKLKVKLNNTSKLKYTDNRIEICTSNFSLPELKSWYNSLNVFVSGVSAEGWGLMQHESMACGRPVIAAAYAGLAEFMNHENSFCLNYKEVPSEQYWKIAGGKWSQYEEEHMIETMRYCYENQTLTEKKGILAAQDASLFTKQKFIDNILNLINIYK